MTTHPIHLLIVDDEAPIRDSLRAFFDDYGLSTRTAASSEAALLLLETHTFRTAIVDMRLPGLDGEGFILRAHQMDPHLFFLIHTGSTNFILTSALRAIGMKDDQVFLKPVFDLSSLYHALQPHL